MGDEIGGHHVSGHIHTTAQVQKIETTENNKRITFQVCSATACLHCTSLHIRVSADGTVLMQKSNPVSLCTQGCTASCCLVLEQLWRLCAAGTQAMDEVYFGQGFYCC